MTLQSWTETFLGPLHSRSTRTLLCAIAALTLLSSNALTLSSAHADANADAEALIGRGIALRREGKDAEALDLFKQAAETSSTPRALAQMGLAEQALGRWVEAETHLKVALDHPNNPWITRNRDTLTRSLEAIGERLGSIELTCDVAGATVLMNGVPAGQTPLSEPLRAVAGTVVIEINAVGFHPMTRSLQVAAGSLARENVTLVAVRATPDPAPTTATFTPVICEGGQVAIEGHCCWPGQAWNTTRQACAGAPQCPQGMIASGLACAPAPVQPAPVTHEHISIRTDVVPVQQPQPEPAAPVDDDSRVAEGGEINLHIGYGGFFRRNGGLFLANNDHGPRAFNLGGVAQFSFGYRLIRWFSFGAQAIGSVQEGNADYWDAQGGEGRLLSLSAGMYFRGHIAGQLFAGAFDLWLGTGFHPFSRVWIDTKDLPNTTISALAIPLEIGATVFGSQSFGIDLKFSMLQWLPLEYCVSSKSNHVCGAAMQSQTSWDAAIGFTWVL